MYKSVFRVAHKITLSARASQAVVLRTKTQKCGQFSIKGSSQRHYASTSKTTNQQATAAAAKAEPFLNGSNSLYVEEMYESWLEDPSSVHKVWCIVAVGSCLVCYPHLLISSKEGQCSLQRGSKLNVTRYCLLLCLAYENVLVWFHA